MVLQRTKSWKELPSELPQGHRAFVTMLRRLRDCSARTQAQIAQQGHLVATSLSNHLNGGRIPEEPQVEAFFKEIQREVALRNGGDTGLPCSLDDLLELRRLARLQHCDCVPHSAGDSLPLPETPDGTPASSPFRPAPSPDPVPEPHPGGAQRLRPASLRRRLRSHSRALSRTSVLAASARRRVPVPLAEGDRPGTDSPGTRWTELETLTGFISSGRHRDAGLLLWRAGRTLSPPELIDVVQSCRTAGLDEAAESVLSGVIERADRQAVLNITAAFQHAGRHADVAFLLAAAAQ
ncbi:hypothetical protein [Streptomyces sp. NPDC056491]|uniref:hypothetical protein n=1 Tax=Streptomyces sp. NPDC056491 TaxID=3345837 RepID=UPI003674E2EB